MPRARKRKGNPINGLVLLDKPLHMSSNQAVQNVKRLFNAQKAGHTGALDPLATGVLPVCLGEATKVSQHLLDADKGYYVKARLGAMTASGDSESEVMETFALPDADREAFERVVEGFVGDSEQVPPMYSALKHNGQPLYKLARKGKEIERKARQITIHAIEVVDYQTDAFELHVVCSKGTYIRTLVEDIGKALGSGAYVLELRRTLAAPFALADCVDLETLKAQLEAQDDVTQAPALKPVAHAIAHWPCVHLDAEQVSDLSFGRRITLTQAASVAGTSAGADPVSHIPLAQLSPETLVGIFTQSTPDSVQPETFLGLGYVDDGVLIPKRLIQSD